MKRTLFLLTLGLAVLTLGGCSLPLLENPTPLPTFIVLPSLPPLSATPTITAFSTPSLPTATPGVAPTATSSGVVPTATDGGSLPASPSGPYGVIRVAAGDVLNIRSNPGAGSPVSGSFSAADTTVIRTGPSSKVGEDLWVQVQNPGGTSGWVNAAYLTEYVTPANFCADARVNALLANFANALKTSNGGTVSALVSPAHGMTVRLWRDGNAFIFDQAHAQWIFVSTYEHNWGAAPGSGLDTIGAIHVVVLPKWLDVLNASYTLGCNIPRPAGPVTLLPGRQPTPMSTSIHSTSPARPGTNSPGGPC